jgi:hypothetical protein
MCNHLNLKILIHIFTIIHLIMIIIIMRGVNFVAHLDGLGGTPVCHGTPVAHHWCSRFKPPATLCFDCTPYINAREVAAQSRRLTSVQINP